jgi:hypothetical protein
MIYLKEPNTDRIVKFESEASIGVSFESWTRCTQEEIDVYELQEAKKIKIELCKAYLNATDWQIIRLADPTSSESIKEGVAEKRALARSLQDEIKACETLEELNNININFE